MKDVLEQSNRNTTIISAILAIVEGKMFNKSTQAPTQKDNTTGGDKGKTRKIQSYNSD